MKRKTGRDYEKEYDDLKKSLISSEAKIGERLLFLCEQNPQAIVLTTKDGIPIKASGFDKKAIDFMNIESKITFIKSIEKWLEKQSNYQQLEIEFLE